MNTQLIKEKQDMTYLSWPFFRPSPGTVGSFLKAYSELGGKKVYYKLSNFDKTQGFDYLNPDNYLTDIVLGIWEKRNPGFIKKCISDAFKTLRSLDHEIGQDDIAP